MSHKYIIYISDQRCTNPGGLVNVVGRLHIAWTSVGLPYVRSYTLSFWLLYCWSCF